MNVVAQSSAQSSVPHLEVTAPGFSITSEQVHAAREASWYATTPYGIAVLRYDEVSRLIKHPNLRQGSGAWPAHNGVTEGPFARLVGQLDPQQGGRGAPPPATPDEPGLLARS